MFHFSLMMRFKDKPFNSKMFYFYFWNVPFQLSEASFSFFFFIFLIFKNHFASNKRKRFSTLCSYLNIHVVYELRRVIKWWRKKEKDDEQWMMDGWLTDRYCRLKLTKTPVRQLGNQRHVAGDGQDVEIVKEDVHHQNDPKVQQSLGGDVPQLPVFPVQPSVVYL